MNNYNNMPAFLRQFVQQQEVLQPQLQSEILPPGGMSAYEINNKSDLEYLPPDTSGRLQIFYCRPENRVYIGRYNYLRKTTDYQAFISEGDIQLAPSQENVMDSGKAMEAMILIATKIDEMHQDIQELKKKPARKRAKKEDLEVEE